MAITFVTNALGGTATTTSFSITLPTTQANDIIILEYTHRGTGDATLGGTYNGPAFTEKHDQQYATSTFSGKTLWSRASGNHSGQTVTGSGLTNSCAAIITIYRGCTKVVDPLSDATVVGEQNASGNETQAQITNVSKGAWIVLVVANSPDLDVSSGSSTDPGALTERAEVLSTGGTDTSISHWSAEKATAGGTGSLTWAQTDAASGSWAYALMPEVAITPTVGALTLGGTTAGRVANENITPPAGEAYFGTMPDAETLTGALALTGRVPTVTEGVAGVVIQPPAGELVLAGVAPAVQWTVTPGAGSLTLSGVAPSPSVGTVITPQVGALALAGAAPSLIEGTVREPGSGALALTGNAPTVTTGTVRQPPVGALALAGVAPTDIDGTVRQPPVGTLTLAGAAPTLTHDTRLTPSSAGLVLAGNDPALQLGGDLPRTPPAGALVLAGLAPSVAWTVTPGTGSLAATGVAPTLRESTAKEAPSGALALTGQAPAVVELHVRTPAAASVVLAGAAPQVVVSTVRAPGAAALAVTGAAPLIQAFEVREPGTGALVLTGQPAELEEPPFGEGWVFPTYRRRRSFVVPDRELVGASHRRPLAFAAPERGQT